MHFQKSTKNHQTNAPAPKLGARRHERAPPNSGIVHCLRTSTWQGSRGFSPSSVVRAHAQVQIAMWILRIVKIHYCMQLCIAVSSPVREWIFKQQVNEDRWRTVVACTWLHAHTCSPLYTHGWIRITRGLLLKPKTGPCYLEAVLLRSEMQVYAFN